MSQIKTGLFPCMKRGLQKSSNWVYYLRPPRVRPEEPRLLPREEPPLE